MINELGYVELLKKILNEGHKTSDRTGTGTTSIFGPQLEYDLEDGFPLFTTKKVFLKGVIHELLWLLSGETNIKYLKDNKVRIWDEWADERGNLGPVYSEMWRKWPNYKLTRGWQQIEDPENKPNVTTFTDGGGEIVYIDQIQNLIDRIKTNPDCRRLIVNAWNPSFLPIDGVHPTEQAKHGKQALPPCHTLFQFKVYDDTLHCKLYQRSADMFLGVPFNVASYSLLTMMIAQVTGLKAGKFIHSFGDAHIYNNHVDQVETQISRDIRRMPSMVLNPEVDDIFNFKYEDFTLVDYEPHPAIKGEVSV